MWVTERLTSLLYGAASGAAIVALSDLPPTTILALTWTAGLATELYRGWRYGDDDP